MAETIVSVSRAAELVRKNRQTLYNLNKRGDLSFKRLENNSKGVEIAELRRVFGKLHVKPAELEENEPSANDSAASATITELRHTIELREMALQHEKDKVDRLTDQMKLLTDEREKDDNELDKLRESVTSVKQELHSTKRDHEDSEKALVQASIYHDVTRKEWEKEQQQTQAAMAKREQELGEAKEAAKKLRLAHQDELEAEREQAQREIDDMQRMSEGSISAEKEKRREVNQQLKALESRGFIARLLNKTPVSA